MGKVTKGYHLEAINPRLAKEWHPKNNGGLTPKDVTPSSGKKVWWLCKKNHEWKAIVADRNRGMGCPYCARINAMQKKVTAKLENRKSALKPIKRGFVRKVRRTSAGNILVEMSPDEWKRLAKETVLDFDLATAILEFRKENSLTQTEFADMAGISRNLVSRIEQGTPRGMHFNTYQRIISTLF